MKNCSKQYEIIFHDCAVKGNPSHTIKSLFFKKYHYGRFCTLSASKMKLNVDFLIKNKFVDTLSKDFNVKAFIAFLAGVATALIGLFVPFFEVLYSTSWFSSFAVSLLVYWVLSYKKDDQIAY